MFRHLVTTSRHQLTVYYPSYRILAVLTLLVLFLLCGLHPLWSQTDPSQLSPDDLFALARQKAFAGEREAARVLCQKILEKNPLYSDVRILLGRTLAWDGRRDEARREFRKVLDARPGHEDALSALIDVDLWDGGHAEALSVAERALQFYPSNEEFLLKKVHALKGLRKDEEAIVALKKRESINPSHDQLNHLRSSIGRRPRASSLGLQYSVDLYLSVYDPMHFVYLQGSQRTGLGQILFRLNYSRRFNSEGNQPEIDFYPILADGIYAYLNYGYSTSLLFPKHRIGAELFSKLPENFEGSLGFRTLYFSASNTVNIYTGSLSLYYGSYWTSLRPYISPNAVGNSISAGLTVRRYLADAENYLWAKAGAGFSPDERNIQSSSGLRGREIFFLEAQSIGAGWQELLRNDLLFRPTLDFTNQELSQRPGEFVQLYSIAAGFWIRF